MPNDPYAAYGGSIAPAAAPAQGGGDPYAAYGGGIASQQQPAQPQQQAQQPSASGDLTSNPHGEGLYQMQSANGPIAVPYSKVRDAYAQGHDFVGGYESAEQRRWNRDAAADPNMRGKILTRGTQAMNGEMPGVDAETMSNVAKGAAKSAVQVPNTLIGWLDSIVGKTDKAITDLTGDNRTLQQVAAGDRGDHPQPVLPKVKALEERMAPGITNPTHGGAQAAGGFMEQLAEWLYGEGEARAGFEALSQSEKLKKLTTAAKFIEEHPKIASVIGNSIGAGAQTAAHGGSGTDVAASAALGGGTTALLHGVGSAAGKLVEHISPEVQNIGGEETPVLRSQITRTNPDGTPQRPTFLQRVAGSESPTVAGQQQAGATRTIRTEAQNVLGRELENANQARTITPNAGGAADTAASAFSPDTGQGAPPASGSPINSVEDVGRTDRELVNGNGLPAGEGNSELARRDMLADERGGGRANGSVEDTSDPALGGGRQAAQIGAGEATPPQPFRFKPINVKDALANTEDFGDAARHLHDAGREVYDRLNEVTGGQWQAVDQRIQQLQGRYQKSYGPERDAIATELQSLNRTMDKLFQQPGTGVSQDALSNAKRLWRSGYLLQDLHNALEPAYQVDADFAKRTGEYRGFNGQSALNRFRTQLRQNPDLKDLLGTDATDNLQRIFRYNTTMAGRARFGEGVSRIARWVLDRGLPHMGIAGPAMGVGYALGGREGAAIAGTGAEALYGTTKYVLHQIATDPRVGKSIMFALDAGARPENFAPHIGELVLRNSMRTAKRYAVPVTTAARNQEDNEQ